MAKTREEAPRFSMAFLGKIAPAGRKVQGSSRPELTATSTKDKFTLNSKACILMDVKPGSRIIMLDQNLGENKVAQDERFLLAVLPEEYKDLVLNATVGKTNAFSYSGVWSAMIMNNPELTEASVPDLVRAGMGILRGKNKKNYVGTKNVVGELSQLILQDEDGNDVTRFQLPVDGLPPLALYKVINLEVRDHEPKSEGSTEETSTED